MPANKFEAFDTIVIKRSQINFADYNPRQITNEAQKKIQRFMKKFGLLGALIWNRSTGNLVSGHQRLSRQDTLMNYPAKVDDYELTVSAVELSEEDEVKANVFLNNTSAMGEWDFETLNQLKDLFPDIDYVKDFGFEVEEVEMFMDLEEPEMTFPSIESSTVVDTVDGLAATAEPSVVGDAVSNSGSGEKGELSEEEKQEFRDIKKKAREQVNVAKADGATNSYASNDYSLSVVFRTAEDKRKFNELLGLAPSEKWCTADQLLKIVE